MGIIFIKVNKLGMATSVKLAWTTDIGHDHILQSLTWIRGLNLNLSFFKLDLVNFKIRRIVLFFRIYVNSLRADLLLNPGLKLTSLL